MGATAPKGCATCGEAKVAPLPTLSEADYRAQVARFAAEPLAAGSPGLETLLFHNVQAREYLSDLGALNLDPEHRSFLEQELSRDHAVLALRIIDADGVERLTFRPTRVPLRTREHLRSTATVDLQAAVASGTVVRVGLERLWVRY